MRFGKYKLIDENELTQPTPTEGFCMHQWESAWYLVMLQFLFPLVGARGPITEHFGLCDLPLCDPIGAEKRVGNFIRMVGSRTWSVGKCRCSCKICTILKMVKTPWS
jgi:hypothetical protein